jgi:hypothetical protein
LFAAGGEGECECVGQLAVALLGGETLAIRIIDMAPNVASRTTSTRASEG